MRTVRVVNYLPAFMVALRDQLISDEARWGDTWRNRTREGQEERIMDTIDDYFDQYVTEDEPIPWLKIAGNAMIAWIRENFDDWKGS